MNTRLAVLALVTALVALGRPVRADEPEPADLVMVNGGVYTMDPAHPWGEAMAIRDGLIVAVGSNQEIVPLTGPRTRIVDLTGRMALPGFHDVHIHPIPGGYTLLGCSLLELPSVDAILDKLKACAQKQPEGCLHGIGFDLSLFPDAAMDKAMLDALFPDRPVYLSASDGHSGWVNSKALEAAGITADTPNPWGGEIVRDPATGEATGTLRDTAMDLFDTLLPGKTLETDIAALRAAQDYLTPLGVTSIIGIAYDYRDWAAFQALEQAGDLHLRVNSALTYGPYAEYPPEEFESVWASRDQYRSELINPDSIKLFLDGGLEGQSAALVEPYTVNPPHKGKLNFEPAELNRLVTHFDAEGIQVHMHAIGDGAVREGLDAVQAALEANGQRDNRHHITHLQLVHPDDYPRFAQLNVTANFQALWAYPDTWIMKLNLPVVGQERVDRMYPIASILRAGGRIAGSSDWDVSSANPLDAIETAIRRQDANQPSGPILNPDERVDLPTMLRAYTVNGAWLMHHERSTGALRPAMQADVAVLDRSLFGIPATEINEAKVVMTVFGGKVVFEAPPPTGE